MTRCLNGVKHPLSENSLQTVIERVESRFVGSIFIPTTKVVEVVVEIPVVDNKVHPETCRCNTCVLAYLDAMEKRINEFADQIEQVNSQQNAESFATEEINYVG